MTERITIEILQDAIAVESSGLVKSKKGVSVESLAISIVLVHTLKKSSARG